MNDENRNLSVVSVVFWSHDDALRASVAASSDGDDFISGSSAGDLIEGHAGNDRLIGQKGDDTFDGSAGDDVLIGSSGLKWLIEDGNWRVERSRDPSIEANGNDTYLFGRGDGRDVVIDGDGMAGNVDTLRFKTGVAPADVILTRLGHDLLLSIGGSTDEAETIIGSRTSGVLTGLRGDVPAAKSRRWRGGEECSNGLWKAAA